MVACTRYTTKQWIRRTTNYKTYPKNRFLVLLILLCHFSSPPLRSRFSSLRLFFSSLFFFIYKSSLHKKCYAFLSVIFSPKQRQRKKVTLCNQLWLFFYKLKAMKQVLCIRYLQKKKVQKHSLYLSHFTSYKSNLLYHHHHHHHHHLHHMYLGFDTMLHLKLQSLCISNTNNT